MSIVGDLGIAVPVGDVPALVKGLSAMIDKLDQVQSSVLRQRIKAEYSVDRMVRATEAMLMETARSRT
ncbi:MAG: hypothetical protein JXA42_02165 [Anaerolineales bacterium]|nr:hypothetical protein [Anaerolineales bacterium]